MNTLKVVKFIFVRLKATVRYFTITPVLSATIILWFFSNQLANDSEIRVELIMLIRSRETGVIEKKITYKLEHQMNNELIKQAKSTTCTLMCLITIRK